MQPRERISRSEKAVRQGKVYAVEEIGKMIDGASSMIVTTFTGLDTARMNLLRRAVWEKSARYVVVKNVLFGIAAKGRGLERLCELLKGQVGIVFGEDDSLDLLRAVVNFSKSNQELKILGGFFEGAVRSAGEMLAIAAMPPRQVALGEFVGTLRSPLSEVMQLLSGIFAGLVSVLGSIGEKKGSVVLEEGGRAG